ncbi:MAG TPA: NRDE family protein [Noviherbaspirillum sp.]|jgi:uncharacterized protein with NRDE domain|uniref:NRDE family protein n=1 Tax=Noviherbaspirillum sp. TaxID=1926288 RepID=UPI002F92C2BE
MCLIVFAWQVVPGIPLLAAGNRDEFLDRPAQPAQWWDDNPDIFAGRDLRAGGSWLGVTRGGRFAAVTNVRAPLEKRGEAESRGALVADFLRSRASPEAYVTELAAHAGRYNPFNLLVADRDSLIWYTNAGDAGVDARNGKPLAPGIYGLSNAQLDTPWPKLVRSKAQFSSLLCQGAPEDAYFEMLGDTSRPSDCRLPKTGVSIEWERVLSAVCIDAPGYGTRVSSLVRLPATGEPVLQERLVR